VNIFRHMDRCTYRKILSTSADGTRRSLEVENEAEWRFLVFSGRFNTRIKVQEDHRGLIMQFELLPSQSMLKKFNGSWTVQPDPENPETWSISTIEHDLSIKWHMPPPFDRVLKVSEIIIMTEVNAPVSRPSALFGIDAIETTY
jgi:hypothetical protein